MAHFDRERIPERVVHARGNGAFGVFKVTHDISKYTSAAIFSKVGKETPVAVRFSTVMTESGAPDTVFGEPRGFATKFYTEEGNWDLVSNNIPVFFIRDPQQFSSLAHSNKRNPQTGVRDANAMWDFFSLRPESLNVLTYVYSDFGIPDGFRFMPGFSIDAFRFVNHHNETIFVKFFWIPLQGIKNLDIDAAAYLRGNIG
jgi:catalase